MCKDIQKNQKWCAAEQVLAAWNIQWMRARKIYSKTLW